MKSYVFPHQANLPLTSISGLSSLSSLSQITVQTALTDDTAPISHNDTTSKSPFGDGDEHCIYNAYTERRATQNFKLEDERDTVVDKIETSTISNENPDNGDENYIEKSLYSLANQQLIQKGKPS